MARRFSITSLPQDVRKVIDSIDWNDGEFEDDVLGQVWLKDGYELEDGSSVFTFSDKQDLINYIREEVRKA